MKKEDISEIIEKLYDFKQKLEKHIDFGGTLGDISAYTQSISSIKTTITWIRKVEKDFL